MFLLLFKVYGFKNNLNLVNNSIYILIVYNLIILLDTCNCMCLNSNIWIVLHRLVVFFTARQWWQVFESFFWFVLDVVV